MPAIIICRKNSVFIHRVRGQQITECSGRKHVLRDPVRLAEAAKLFRPGRKRIPECCKTNLILCPVTGWKGHLFEILKRFPIPFGCLLIRLRTALSLLVQRRVECRVFFRLYGFPPECLLNIGEKNVHGCTVKNNMMEIHKKMQGFFRFVKPAAEQTILPDQERLYKRLLLFSQFLFCKRHDPAEFFLQELRLILHGRHSVPACHDPDKQGRMRSEGGRDSFGKAYGVDIRRQTVQHGIIVGRLAFSLFTLQADAQLCLGQRYRFRRDLPRLQDVRLRFCFRKLSGQIPGRPAVIDHPGGKLQIRTFILQHHHPDAVAAHAEKVIVDTDPRDIQHSCEGIAELLFGLISRRGIFRGPGRNVRSLERRAVQLPVRIQGKCFQPDKKCRHHVFGKTGTHCPAQVILCHFSLRIPHIKGADIGLSGSVFKIPDSHIPDARNRTQCLLDLSRFDPLPADFDHPVLAVQVQNISIRESSDDVTCP